MSALWKTLGCFGYNGFGSGYAKVAYGQPDDTREMACGRCDRKGDCWERHKLRVRTLLPGMCELSDEIIAEGKTGTEYVMEFNKRIAAESKKPVDPNKMVEPYLMVMLGNMQDGSAIASQGVPFDRKEVTLSWPLTPLE